MKVPELRRNNCPPKSPSDHATCVFCHTYIAASLITVKSLTLDRLGKSPSQSISAMAPKHLSNNKTLINNCSVIIYLCKVCKVYGY